MLASPYETAAYKDLSDRVSFYGTITYGLITKKGMVPYVKWIFAENKMKFTIGH